MMPPFDPFWLIAGLILLLVIAVIAWMFWRAHHAPISNPYYGQDTLFVGNDESVWSELKRELEAELAKDEVSRQMERPYLDEDDRLPSRRDRWY